MLFQQGPYFHHEYAALLVLVHTSSPQTPPPPTPPKKKKKIGPENVMLFNSLVFGTVHSQLRPFLWKPRQSLEISAVARDIQLCNHFCTESHTVHPYTQRYITRSATKPSHKNWGNDIHNDFIKQNTRLTVLPAKGDSDVMFCLQSY